MSVLPFRRPEERRETDGLPEGVPARFAGVENGRPVVQVAAGLTAAEADEVVAEALRGWRERGHGIPALVPAAVLAAGKALRTPAGISAAAGVAGAAGIGTALMLAIAASPAHPVRMAESPAHAVVRSSTSPYPSMPRPAPGARGGSGDGGGVPDPAPGTLPPALVTPAPARTSPPGVLPHILPTSLSSLPGLPGLPLPLPTKQVSGVVPEVTHTAHKVERVVCHLNLLGTEICVKIQVP